MTFDEFLRVANEIFDAIPEEFRRGVDGLRVLEEALPHPDLPHVYTLGHCDTEAYPSDWSGPDTTRSVVTLLYGSFRRLADLDPYFDWEDELWETVTHELRHHLESLAGEDQLERVDYAADESFKRMEGLPFDPWYYREGEEVGRRLFQVEHDLYLEQLWGPNDFTHSHTLTFWLHDQEWEIPTPPELGDIHFVFVDGIDVGPGELQLALLRRRDWRERLHDLAEGIVPDILESEGTATPVQ